MENKDKSELQRDAWGSIIKESDENIISQPADSSPSHPELSFSLKCTITSTIKKIFKLTISYPKSALLLLILIIFSTLPDSPKSNIKKDNDRVNASDEVTLWAQSKIRLSGYRCDSVSFILRKSWDGSFRVTCNDDYYAYSIKDIGGNWIVEVD